jgi:hypothetical protein
MVDRRVMSDHLDLEILHELWKCSHGDLSIEDFQAWFAPISLDVEQSGQPEAIELAHRVEGVLAEASSGGWSEDELLQEIVEIVRYSARSIGENRYGNPSPVAESNATSVFIHAAA